MRNVGRGRRQRSLDHDHGPVVATSLLSCIGFASLRAKYESQTDIAQQQIAVQQQAQSYVDTQRNEAEQQALKSADPEAIDAIRETENAISNITDNKADEAVAAIQRASSKLDSVLSRILQVR
jgi:hypothetical protein